MAAWQIVGILGCVGAVIALLVWVATQEHRRLDATRRRAFAPCAYCGRHPYATTTFGLLAPVPCLQMAHDLETLWARSLIREVIADERRTMIPTTLD